MCVAVLFPVRSYFRLMNGFKNVYQERWLHDELEPIHIFLENYSYTSTLAIIVPFSRQPEDRTADAVGEILGVFYKI